MYFANLNINDLISMKSCSEIYVHRMTSQKFTWHFTIYWYHFLSSVSTFMQNMNKKSLTLVVSLVTLIIFLILSNFNFLILIISKEELPQISKNVKTEQNQKANILQHSTQENFEFSSSSTNVSRKQSISSLL